MFTVGLTLDFNMPIWPVTGQERTILPTFPNAFNYRILLEELLGEIDPWDIVLEISMLVLSM